MPLPRPSAGLNGCRVWNRASRRNNVNVATGAESPALHPLSFKGFERDGEIWPRFVLYPLQRNTRTSVAAEAPLVGRRWVTSLPRDPSLRSVIRARIEL